MLIKRWTFYDPVEIEIRLPFYRSFLTFWNVSDSALCTQSFYTWVRSNLKSSVTFKIKSSVFIPDMETILATTHKIYS